VGKAAVAILVLGLGLAAGLWLALGPRAPAGVGESWDHVKVAVQQMQANAESKIHEAQLPRIQGGPAGPNLIERITTPFAGFAAGMQNMWLNMAKSIRPPH
jgi:hypothetical protein